MKKRVLLLNYPKLNESASPRYLVLFPVKSMLAFQVKYDQNYGFWYANYPANEHDFAKGRYMQIISEFLIYEEKT